MSTDATNQDLERSVAEAVDALDEGAAGTTGQRLEGLYEKARQTRDKLNTLLADLGSKAGETGKAVEVTVKDGIEQTEQKIKERPWTAVGIAAGAGILLGLLLNRNR
jgi:ElaB/YqjD/DUF883 family membrane-anchored ribosome-binding protein